MLLAAMTRRRLCLNLALALVLCLCLVPFHASADSSNLVVNGMEYVATANHEGSGWSYTYASGMGYLRLNGYNGGPIVLPLSASVEYDGTNMITAKEGENALYCTGEVLSLGSRENLEEIGANLFKILRKFESLNLAYIRDEVDGYIQYLNDHFGEENMTESKEYLERLKKLF